MTKAPSVVEAIYLSKSFAPHLLDLFDLHHSHWKELNTLGEFATFWKDDPQSLYCFINSSEHVCPFFEVAHRWLDFLRHIKPYCDPKEFEAVVTICTNLLVFGDLNTPTNELKEYLDYALSDFNIAKNILSYFWICNPLNEPSKKNLFNFMRQWHTEQTILQSLIDLYNLGKNYTNFYSPSIRGKRMDLHVEALLSFIPPLSISSLENTAQLAADNLNFARWLCEQQQNLFLHVVSKDLQQSQNCPRKM